jgi:hypothetical protein
MLHNNLHTNCTTLKERLYCLNKGKEYRLLFSEVRTKIESISLQNALSFNVLHLSHILLIVNQLSVHC